MSTHKIETILAHAGSNPKEFHGVVNPPVHRASTIVFEKYEDFENLSAQPYTYGRSGTPTSAAFEQAITKIEGAFGSVSGGSGLSVIVAAITGFVSNGDHILMADCIYGPTRKYAQNVLARFGVEVEFYDPMLGADIAKLFKKNTRLVYLEAPASLTFEVQDVGTIIAQAKKAGIRTIMDNSWGTPLLLKPLELGADVSVMSATKYISGHSDCMLGVASATEEAWPILKKSALAMGLCAGSEELYLGLRGLRTLSVRMKAHETAALDLANWLATRPEVARVMHPALPASQGHAHWKKYFKGSSGTFAIALEETRRDKIAAMLNGMKTFRMGFSWGGYESLLFPEQPCHTRSATKCPDGFNLRLHVGFENLDDLKEDLEAGFKRLNA